MFLAITIGIYNENRRNITEKNKKKDEKLQNNSRSSRRRTTFLSKEIDKDKKLKRQSLMEKEVVNSLKEDQYVKYNVLDDCFRISYKEEVRKRDLLQNKLKVKNLKTLKGFCNAVHKKKSTRRKDSEMGRSNTSILFGRGN